MKIIDANEVRALLTMPECINLMKEAFKKLESGNAGQPIRTIHPFPDGNLFGFMPAWLDDCFGAKIITANHGNVGTKYPSHMGYVMVFDSAHGAPIGMADAGVITEMRTGAVSAVATDLLARKDASKLAIIGCGAQGRSHLAAIMCVRDIKEVYCYDIVPESAQKYAKEQSEKYGIAVIVKSSVKDAVLEADIVCTLTPSKEAYLEADWISSGTHINAVGTFSPTTREVTSELVAKSKLYADNIESMKKEAGEYLIPLKEGLIDESHIVGSLGEVLLGKAPARQTSHEITLFDALGLAVEDVTCARYLVWDN